MIYIDPETKEAYEVDIPNKLKRLTRAQEDELRTHFEQMREVDLGLSHRQGTHDALMNVLRKLGYSFYNKEDARRMAARLLGED